jgi:AP2-associated kinase
MVHPIPAYAQPHGTLAPGQTISVNKYTVQVERYLSQGEFSISTVIARSGTQPLTGRNPTTGGFAHVYLVRTSAPVYGTTHHVLKRIAVSNDGMLTDVKKEVDIMVSIRYQPLSANNCTPIWSLANIEGSSEHRTPHRCCMAQAIKRDL